MLVELGLPMVLVLNQVFGAGDGVGPAEEGDGSAHGAILRAIDPAHLPWIKPQRWRMQRAARQRSQPQRTSQALAQTTPYPDRPVKLIVPAMLNVIVSAPLPAAQSVEPD